MTDLLIKLSPIIGTIFFFVIFCYVFYIVFKKSNKKKFDKYSKIPMDDDRL